MDVANMTLPNTLRLPVWLWGAIRDEARATNRTQTEILLEQMSKRYADQDGPFFVPEEKVNTYQEKKVKEVTDHTPTAQPVAAGQ